MEEREPDSIIALLREAHLLHLRGQLEPAAEKCRAILALDKGHWEAHELLGDLLSDQGKPEAAIAEYRAALAVAPAQEQLEKKIARVSLLQAQIASPTQPGGILNFEPLTPRKPALAALLSVVTGLGQLYNGQFIKGSVLLLVEIILLMVIAIKCGPVVRQMKDAGDPLAQFGLFFAPFTAPVLIWTILAALGWFYGVIDAAIVAGRLAEERTSSELLTR